MMDGYLLVHYVGTDEPEKFPFSDQKLWYWSTMMSCSQQVAKDVLVIARENGRTEIPRSSIRKVDVMYNTTDAMIEEVVKFANGEHDGPVHPSGD